MLSMRVRRGPRQKVLSIRVTDEVRTLIEQAAAKKTSETKERWTITDVIEAAVKMFAKRAAV